MTQSIILMAVVNGLLAAFMFSKIGGTGVSTIDLGAPETRRIYAVIGGVYALTALTLVAAVPLV